MKAVRTSQRELFVALAFLSPNILGFLAFILFPLVFSLILAFTNWDLKLHNMFKEESIRFVGIDNFFRLFDEPQFWRFLGNTLFLMMAIPFSVGGSLLAAILLSKDMRGGGGRVFAWLIASAGLLAATLLLAVVGAGGTALTLLLVGVVGCILVGGVAGGTGVYRTLFYTPHFVTGVSTFLLWKKMYAPIDGPINTALRPVLGGLAATVNAAPTALVAHGGMAVAFLLLLATFAFTLNRLRRMWRDGELGWRASIVPLAFVLLPVIVGAAWWSAGPWKIALIAVAGLVVAWQVWRVAGESDALPAPATTGFGTAVMLALGAMVVELTLLGLGQVAYALPAMAADGLAPPQWIHDYNWAKPSLMIMGFWGAIGSNNMLLYLAALTNVPQELYEAADIDGASRLQRFWNVTWPQLAPTTFFIVVMSTIGGIQGGFEMARTMTQGGPAGSTTTLAYFIYIEGFETGRLGYASAIAWALFGLVFVLTLINWKFGNRYVNE